MDNIFQLTADIVKIEPLRYTPAGVPILEMYLQHQSVQAENQSDCLVKFELEAKIIGQLATVWQHRLGATVSVTGFLAQKSLKIPRPVLRIQSITEYKG